MNELTLTELDMGFSIPKILHASAPTVDHQGRNRSHTRYVMFFTHCSGWSATKEMYYFPAINLLSLPLLAFIITQAVCQFMLRQSGERFLHFCFALNPSPPSSFPTIPKIYFTSLWIKTFLFQPSLLWSPAPPCEMLWVVPQPSLKH